MGCLQIRTMKIAKRIIIEKHYIHMGNDFHINKCMGKETVVIPNKMLHKKITGYVIHLMKTDRESPCERISITLQEERKMTDTYVLEISAFDQEITKMNHDTKNIQNPGLQQFF
ncbi:small ribosomal subunit protein eS17-like [Macrotis lagotis]|uniref:small ribosomal subunit protein eS17-like n=1 Tax=Macrotis lagotis TaxID=92651 RepID=UPI003D687DFE